MKISPIILKSIKRSPPQGWKLMWNGYFQMERVVSQKKIDRDKKTHKFSKSDVKGEGYIERQFFLNIIKSLEGNINIVELGAGRGDWCLALAGVVDFNLISHKILSYKCYGVEAEPTHFKWMKTHFEVQKINAVPIFGAISNFDGESKFYSVGDPASGYGQAISKIGNLTVPTYTLDTLVKKYQLDEISLLHSDIQGEEFNMLKGAVNTLQKQKIKYMIIGMHIPNDNNKIIEFLDPYGYKPLFSAEVHSGECSTPFGKAVFPVDGLLVMERV